MDACALSPRGRFASGRPPVAGARVELRCLKSARERRTLDPPRASLGARVVAPVRLRGARGDRRRTRGSCEYCRDDVKPSWNTRERRSTAEQSNASRPPARYS